MVHRQLRTLHSILNAASELIAWALRRRRRFCVGGRSMLPALEPGEFVLVNTRKPPRVGDLVVADHPHRKMQLVKRVQRFTEAGELVLLSDNEEEGTDSRSFGPVPARAVAGVVTLSLEHLLKDLRG